jgi:hypothetical protein
MKEKFPYNKLSKNQVSGIDWVFCQFRFKSIGWESMEQETKTISVGYPNRLVKVEREKFKHDDFIGYFF